MVSANAFSQPPCPPFSPCWCQQHPTHPNCNTVNTPINGGIVFLLIGGLLFGAYMIKKQRKNEEIQ